MLVMSSMSTADFRRINYWSETLGLGGFTASNNPSQVTMFDPCSSEEEGGQYLSKNNTESTFGIPRFNGKFLDYELGAFGEPGDEWETDGSDENGEDSRAQKRFTIHLRMRRMCGETTELRWQEPICDPKLLRSCKIWKRSERLIRKTPVYVPSLEVEI